MTQPDVDQIATLLAGRLIERRDAMAIQFTSGGYTPVRDRLDRLLPFTRSDLVRHVEGTQTLGHYVVSAENKCRIFAFDIDLVKHSMNVEGETVEPRVAWLGPDTPAKRHLAMQLASMAEELATRTRDLLGLQVTVSYSGSKGMHVIGLLDPGTTAEDARNLGQIVLDSFDADADGEMELYKGKNFYRHCLWPALEVELFPKQDGVRAGDGLGNLLRLPLGVNQKTGKHSWFMDLSEPACSFRKLDPLVALTRGSL